MPAKPLGPRLDPGISGREARIAALAEDNIDRCRDCGYPLANAVGPCPGCRSRSERAREEARARENNAQARCSRCRVGYLDAVGRCPVCSPRRSTVDPPANGTAAAPKRPDWIKSFASVQEPDPPPTREEPPVSVLDLLARPRAESDPAPAPVPSGLGECPKCHRPYGKIRRCFTCSPTRPDFAQARQALARPPEARKARKAKKVPKIAPAKPQGPSRASQPPTLPAEVAVVEREAPVFVLDGIPADRSPEAVAIHTFEVILTLCDPLAAETAEAILAATRRVLSRRRAGSSSGAG